MSYSQNNFGWLLSEKITKDFAGKNNNNKNRKLIFA